MERIMEVEQFGLTWQVMVLRKARMVRMVKARKAKHHPNLSQRVLVPWWSRQEKNSLLILMMMMIHHPRRKPRLQFKILMILSEWCDGFVSNGTQTSSLD